MQSLESFHWLKCSGSDETSFQRDPEDAMCKEDAVISVTNECKV